MLLASAHRLQNMYDNTASDRTTRNGGFFAKRELYAVHSDETAIQKLGGVKFVGALSGAVEQPKKANARPMAEEVDGLEDVG